MKPTTQLLLAGCALLCSACSGGARTKSAEADTTSRIEASSQTAVATTQSGKVAGYAAGNLYVFKGIPYARAERFMPPQAPEKWEGIRSSRAYGPTCPQAVRGGWQSDEHSFAFDWDDGHPGEDCLRVNIWTPALADGKKRPVMVWLHGGGYAAGSGQELPSYDAANLPR